MEHVFPVAGPVRVQASTRSADLVLAAVPTAEVAVRVETHRGSAAAPADAADVRLVGDVLRISVPPGAGSSRLRVTVTAPEGSDLEAAAGSGDITTAGALRRLEVRGGSGDVDAARAERARLTLGSGDITLTSLGAGELVTGSGDVRIGAGSDVRVRCGSGDVLVEHAENLETVTGSGDLRVLELAGEALVRTASGAVDVRRAAGGRLDARTASGDITVRVAAGTAAMLDCSTVSGSLRSTLEPADEPGPEEPRLFLRARTVSGNISVHRAP